MKKPFSVGALAVLISCALTIGAFQLLRHGSTQENDLHPSPEGLDEDKIQLVTPASGRQPVVDASSSLPYSLVNYPAERTTVLELGIVPPTSEASRPFPGQLLVLTSADVEDPISEVAGALDLQAAAATWAGRGLPVLRMDVSQSPHRTEGGLRQIRPPVPLNAVWLRVFFSSPSARGETLVRRNADSGGGALLDLAAAGSLELTVLDHSQPSPQARLDKGRLWVYGSPQGQQGMQSRSLLSFEQTYQTGEALALEGLPLGYSFRITAVSAAGAEGTIPSWRPVIGRRDRQTLVIQPRVRITGVVTDEADQPLPGSTITCYIAVNQAVRGTNSTETDIEGRFCLDFHGSGQTSLSVSKPGYQGRLEALGFLEAGQLLDNMRLTLHACPTVVGVVKEVAGPVVPGALVQYMDPRHLSAGIISSHADLNGRFSIPIRGEMPVLLWAFVAQPDPDTGLPQASAIMPLSKVPDDLMILVETPPGALTVTIRDDLGQPVFSCAVEARLVADPRSALLRRKLQTGDRSEFTLRGLVNGLWQVEVLREGYLQQEQRLSAIDGSSVSTEIVLERPGSLRGQVVNLGGVPVDHASTSLLSKGDHGGQHWRPVDTSQADWGDEGTFSFASLPPGIYKVTATDAGRGFGQSQSAILRAGENVELDPIVLEELGEIRGRVVDRTTGTGLAGIQIASMPLWDPGFPLPQITASSVGGAFEFPGLRPGLYRLEVLSDKGGEIPGGDPQDGIGSRWGRHSQNIEVTSGRISHAEMFLRDSWGVLLEGVIEEAARVADLHVQLHPLPTIEDPFHSFARDTISPQGYFRLRSSTAGWHLLAICSTLADSVYEERIYLHAGANSCTVRIPTGSVSGRVRLVGSRPEFAPHRVVVETQDAGMAFGRDDSARKRVRTDVDGNFVIRGLPDGRYLVRAGGQLDGANSTTGAVVLPNVVVEQGADTNLGEILLQPAGGIVGMVFDGHGYALAGAEILVWTAGGEVLQPSSWSDHNGRFRVRGVSPGNYAVAARTTDMCCAPEWITCGGGDSDEQVVLNLSESPVVTLRFRWPDESASTPPWAVLSVRSESGITWKPPGRSLAFQAIQKGQDNRGKIALGPMPPGLYTVDIRHSPRGGVTRQMVVEPGHADKVEVIEFE